MQKSLVRKGLVLGIIVLFVGTSVVPSISGNIESSISNNIIYVDDDAPNSGQGTSWSDAFNHLQDALAAAEANDEIRVAKGEYRPDRGNNQTPGDRYATFQLLENVTMKGGYAGLGTAIPDARNIRMYETVLSGDLADNDGPGFENYTENSLNVITGNNTQETTIIDGFTITGGCANENSPPEDRWGGGMYNKNGSPTIINCTFSMNYAWYGGGIFNIQHSSPTVINCTFIENTAYSRGGGVGNFINSNPTLINCVFIGNSAYHWTGGGMHNYYSNPTLINCIFNGNTAVDAGGGICNYDCSNLLLINCIFSANSAPYGRAHACDSQHQQGPSNTRIINCIIWDGGDEMWNNDNSTIDITYSDVQDGWPGLGNIDLDPLFVDPDGMDDIPATEDDNLRLLPDSPCIDAADNSAIPDDIFDLDSDGIIDEPIPLDLDDNPRFVEDPNTNDTGNGTPPIVDMGAYEFQVVILNNPPLQPNISGFSLGVTGVEYTYTAVTTDPDDDDIAEYIVNWGDGTG